MKLTRGDSDPKCVADALRDYAAGASSYAVAEKYGFTPRQVQTWSSSFDGMDKDAIARYRATLRELTTFKRRCLRQEKELKAGAAAIKLMCRGARNRSVLATTLSASFGLSVSSANRIVGVCHGAGRSRRSINTDNDVVAAMKSYKEENPGQGFSQMYQMFLKGMPSSRNKSLKLYNDFCLRQIEKRKRSELPRRISKKWTVTNKQDAMWSIDFLIDTLDSGKRFYILSCIDDFNREVIFCKVLSRSSARSVVDAMNLASKVGRTPGRLRSDNGSEFRSILLKQWAKSHDVVQKFTRPGRCEDNLLIERFNGTLRREIFDWFSFSNLADIQRFLDDWTLRFNISRPHSALKGLSPVQYSFAIANAAGGQLTLPKVIPAKLRYAFERPQRSMT